MSNKEERGSTSSFQIRVHPTDEVFVQADQDESSGCELMRKSSGPPCLASQSRSWFNNLKLGIVCPNFSASNASEEPLSAASFSGKGFSASPDHKIEGSEDTTEILTPTLPAHDKEEEVKEQPRYDQQIDLDHELLSN